jgi:N-acetylglucosamine-6-sulfatase
MAPRRRRFRRLTTVVVAAALLWVGTGASIVQSQEADDALVGTDEPLIDLGLLEDAPNIVLILTDDQRWDTLKYMPTVRSELMNEGATFKNAFVVNSLCCPSRVTTLTGTYSHTNHVYSNIGSHGGWPAFTRTPREQSNTVATWLNDAGYNTALIGKYLNGYGASAGSVFVPNGWDNWIAFTEERGEADYYNYALTGPNSTIERHGSKPEDYATDVLAEHAEDFIRDTPEDEPLFLYFAPSAPHAWPIPAPRHYNSFRAIKSWRPPSYNERYITDKPKYLQDIRRFSEKRKREIDKLRRRQVETLQAVDDAVDQILETLSETGRLPNTLIIFASDNGLSWGEHRWVGKLVPYEESIRIPLVMRWDGHISNEYVERRMALNLDLAQTIADGAGVNAPGAEGRSLLRLLSDRDASGRDRFVIEHLGVNDHGPSSYCAVRTNRFLYVWQDVRKGIKQELYDLRKDPFQRDNVARKASRHDLLLSLRRAARRQCDPRPYGMRKF